MNTNNGTSRRSFLKNSSLTLGAGIVGLPATANEIATANGKKKSSRNICVASIDLYGLWPETTREARIKKILQRMEGVVAQKPDLICLPEMFDTSWVEETIPINEIAEDENSPGPVTSRIAAFAKKNNCYVACPIITRNNGKFYNSCLLIDRKGSIAGVYHKTHPTDTEILPDQAFKDGGVTPGRLDQKVIDTDFGKVGMQICYDANWHDGWDNLRSQGADIVLFPSQFPGGRMLNYYALKYGYYIVSSTGQDARIIDKSGNNLEATTEFVRYVWSAINLEKVNVPVWPTNAHIPDLYKKYGEKIAVKTWNTTDVITIESRDPDLNILDVMKEFNIRTNADLLEYETKVQNEYRSAVSKG